MSNEEEIKKMVKEAKKKARKDREKILKNLKEAAKKEAENE
jgi:hypothetical protein